MAGDNKKKESKDLLASMDLLDEEKYKVPTFLAADLNKELVVKVSKADICALMFKIEELVGMIDQL